MKKNIQIALTTLLIFTMLFIKPTNSYIPSNELVFGQQKMQNRVPVDSNFTVGIFIKNFFNYTITNVTVTLNLTVTESLKLTSCEFGSLDDGNITLENPMQSSSENGFTAMDITYGYFTENVLTFNISQIVNGTEFIFFYNVTSGDSGSRSLPRADMTYYDHYPDLNEASSQLDLLLEFYSEEDVWDSSVPNWRLGKQIKIGWGWFVFAFIPIIAAVVASVVLYIRRR
ncbi:MAG: hypothetical protein HGN29_00670 [Asgard group archaeon]|nr:hypothetical protein [Asgard group archaeon]